MTAIILFPFGVLVMIIGYFALIGFWIQRMH